MSVKIYITLILLIIYYFIIGKLELFLMFYNFAIMHELSHMIVALLLNIDITEISLMPVGVSAKYIGKLSDKKEFLVSIAGPLSSIAFALIYHNKLYFTINILILVFNCIPIYPFDGGRILRIILKIFLGKQKGKRVSTYLSYILLIIMFLISIFIAAYFKNFFFLFLMLYVYKISSDEIKKEKLMNIINYLQIDK